MKFGETVRWNDRDFTFIKSKLMSNGRNMSLIVNHKGVIGYVNSSGLKVVAPTRTSPVLFKRDVKGKEVIMHVRVTDNHTNYFNHEWEEVSAEVKGETVTLPTQRGGYRYFKPRQYTMAEDRQRLTTYYEQRYGEAYIDVADIEREVYNDTLQELVGDITASCFVCRALHIDGDNHTESEPFTINWSVAMGWSLDDKAYNVLEETEVGCEFLHNINGGANE
ncbi:hypothetical protein [Vibrio phage vB_VibM_83AMN]|nr:hypothetical protein [Vibrio phage vB_VibM_83AMN]